MYMKISLIPAMPNFQHRTVKSREPISPDDVAFLNAALNTPTPLFRSSSQVPEFIYRVTVPSTVELVRNPTMLMRFRTLISALYDSLHAPDEESRIADSPAQRLAEARVEKFEVRVNSSGLPTLRIFVGSGHCDVRIPEAISLRITEICIGSFSGVQTELVITGTLSAPAPIEIKKNAAIEYMRDQMDQVLQLGPITGQAKARFSKLKDEHRMLQQMSAAGAITFLTVMNWQIMLGKLSEADRSIASQLNELFVAWAQPSTKQFREDLANDWTHNMRNSQVEKRYQGIYQALSKLVLSEICARLESGQFNIQLMDVGSGQGGYLIQLLKELATFLGSKPQFKDARIQVTLIENEVIKTKFIEYSQITVTKLSRTDLRQTKPERIVPGSQDIVTASGFFNLEVLSRAEADEILPWVLSSMTSNSCAVITGATPVVFDSTTFEERGLTVENCMLPESANRDRNPSEMDGPVQFYVLSKK